MATDTLSQVFAALADPTRRDMVARLSEGDATVSRLAEPYRISLQAVYKHLRVLEDAGLVSRRAARSPGRCAWRPGRPRPDGRLDRTPSAPHGAAPPPP
ncbi:ArsR/SmtB family transcription factor [Actinomadura madurae]|uniref:ArsR/SmtB family transcription factor n=1 Tax=Actinomadura madurae TaxID=1993 RepID=UPI003557853A